MIEVRYTLNEVIETCILYKLDKDEIYSAIMSEVSFKRTSKTNWILGVILVRLYLQNRGKT